MFPGVVLLLVKVLVELLHFLFELFHVLLVTFSERESSVPLSLSLVSLMHSLISLGHGLVDLLIDAVVDGMCVNHRYWSSDDGRGEIRLSSLQWHSIGVRCLDNWCWVDNNWRNWHTIEVRNSLNLGISWLTYLNLSHYFGYYLILIIKYS